MAVMPARALATALVFLLALPGFAQSAPPAPYDSVDPLIGTAGGGNTFPGASLPGGMIQWSPDTGPDAWYRYDAHRITGFSLTHLSGAGCPVFGDLPVLPWAGELSVSPHANRALYSQPFNHEQEVAHPGYYAVTLRDGIRVEMTVSERAGIARFTFPEGTPARLLLNAGGSANSDVAEKKSADAARGQDGYRVRLVGSNAVEGEARGGGFCSSASRYTLYFAAEFSKPFVRTAMWRDDTVERAAKQESARHAGAWLDFGSEREVVMKVGVSFVSVANARANLDREIPGWDFEHVHDVARHEWSALFDQIQVAGGTSAQRTIFYTGMYHMFLSPNIFSDENGDYMGQDGKVHGVREGCSGAQCNQAQYTNFSDWDIYRDVIQLQAILSPQRASDEAESLVRDAEQTGWFPRWPAANDVTYVMGGDSPTAVVAEAYAFGAHDFDVQSALHSMVKAATMPGIGSHGGSERPFLAAELRYGYIPDDDDKISASRTLEYASDDFAIAQFASANGDGTDAALLMKRAGNWQNLFDSQSKWIRPRASDGSWLRGFDAERSLPRLPNSPAWVGPVGYEEGNASQYSFMIPFDYPRLIAAMGGDAVVVPRLNRFFSKLICWNEPCFNMGNEPDFVTPYVYAYTNAPWKIGDVITRIEQQTLSTKPDGIPGNDDLGATSGVYVWNALGLYPGVPGAAGLFVGTPMFRSATIRFGGNEHRTLTVRANGDGPYVTSLALDGKPYNRLWLPLDLIGSNATTTLTFTLQPSEPRSTVLQAPPVFRP